MNYAVIGYPVKHTLSPVIHNANFKALNINVIGIKEHLPDFDVEETGTTFEENAVLKAEAAAHALNLPVISDDSGIEVDVLNGAPGVYSARYAGGAGDAANNEKLLKNMQGETNRRARFISVIAVAIPNQETRTFTGTVEGNILTSLVGSGGFGYDPLFETLDGLKFGEIDPAEKNAISHRANALKLLQNDKELLQLLKGD